MEVFYKLSNDSQANIIENCMEKTNIFPAKHYQKFCRKLFANMNYVMITKILQKSSFNLKDSWIKWDKNRGVFMSSNTLQYFQHDFIDYEEKIAQYIITYYDLEHELSVPRNEAEKINNLLKSQMTA